MLGSKNPFVIFQENALGMATCLRAVGRLQELLAKSVPESARLNRLPGSSMPLSTPALGLDVPKKLSEPSSKLRGRRNASP